MTAETLEVSLEDLIVSSTNARKDKEAGQEDAGLAGLAQSIKEVGLLNPLTVRRTESGKFEILAGQRRYLACRQLGIKKISVNVRKTVDDTNAVALSLIENVQRADMHPIDKAEAFKSLHGFHRGDLHLVAKSTGVSAQTVQKYLLLLNLPEHLRDQLGTQKGAAGVGAMSNIAKTFDSPEDMEDAWDKIGGFTQDIQNEILKRSGGNIKAIPELVIEALDGAFDAKKCGNSASDCPHIPDELRVPLQQAITALNLGEHDPAKSLRDVAAQHRLRSR